MIFSRYTQGVIMESRKKGVCLRGIESTQDYWNQNKLFSNVYYEILELKRIFVDSLKLTNGIPTNRSNFCFKNSTTKYLRNYLGEPLFSHRILRLGNVLNVLHSAPLTQKKAFPCVESLDKRICHHLREMYWRKSQRTRIHPHRSSLSRPIRPSILKRRYNETAAR